MKIHYLAIVLTILILLTSQACSPTTSPVNSPETIQPTSTQQPTIPESSTEQVHELSIEIISVTSPVSPGSNATLVAQTTPGANCDIDVYYKSGASTAQGLYPKVADNSGRVSWTWKVGTRTTPGSWGIVVRANHNEQTTTQTTHFTVR